MSFFYLLSARRDSPQAMNDHVDRVANQNNVGECKSERIRSGALCHVTKYLLVFSITHVHQRPLWQERGMIHNVVPAGQGNKPFALTFANLQAPHAFAAAEPASTAPRNVS